MAGTRSSTRQAEKATSSPASAEKASGTKRKADDSSPSSAAKRGRPAKATKEQKTIEETMPADDEVEAEIEKDNAGEEKRQTNGHAKDHVNGDESHKEEADETAESGGKKGEPTENGDAMDVDKKDVEPTTDNNTNALDKVKADDGDAGTTHKTTEANKTADNDVKADAVEEHKQREQAMPSNILEKGIIYFFTRDRVGIDGADSVQDLARTYCVMRPLPDGAKITDGAMPDLKNNRLIALPKKVWPKSGKDRFMAFVEQAQVSNQTLKEKFYSGSDYTTKTTGTRHTPEVTPLGEGVYAMTTTGGGQGTTHLVYMLTIPEEIGEVQKDVGLADKGSFVVSLKNPKSSGPSYAQLPQKPDFPDEVFEEFRGRGWMPAHPKHLDYANAQMLLIGENFESSDNLEAAAKDAKDDSKETPQEELEKLEHEDELRVERLKGDDTIFVDLGISSKEYPKVKTTW